MHLRLSLPPRTDTPDTHIETRPAEMERWLKSLPLLNLTESTQLLARQLVGLNRIAIDDKQRLRLLETLRAPVQHLSLGLQKTYIGLPCHCRTRRARLLTSCGNCTPRWHTVTSSSPSIRRP